jgi:putative transposase
MMERDELPNRRSIRLKGYDYTRDGAYFVTICTHDRERTFGTVVRGEMRLNACGREAARCWAWLAEQYPYVSRDEWIVMPDHTHAILVIKDDHRNRTVRDGSSTTNPNERR